ncbi:MAG: tetratricopeptide repeat protein, partial [Acidimicrobiales bacterium]
TPERANPVIAVLSFESLSDDAAQAHVADGLTHDIVTALSKHRWLRVLTRSMVDRFRDEPDAVSRLCEEFGVDYVVEGTVRRADDRLRVTVGLTAASDGTSLWAERYDRQFEDIFTVQDEITQVIAANIEPEVGYAERDRVSRTPPADLQAWDLYHLGVAHFFRFTAEDNLEAQRLLAMSRDRDPSFGDAHAWWAYATVLGMVYWDTNPEPEVLDAALEATQSALQVDSHNAVFHALRGRVQLARREYSSALLENQRALELNPTFAAAYCGLGDSLCYEGRYDEAIEQFEQAVALGAHDPQKWAFLSYGALALLFDKRFEDALEWSEQAMTIPNCQYWTFAHRVVALAHLDRIEEARDGVEELVRRCPQFSIDYAQKKLFYLKRPEQLELYLDGLAKAGVAGK